MSVTYDRQGNPVFDGVPESHFLTGGPVAGHCGSRPTRRAAARPPPLRPPPPTGTRRHALPFRRGPQYDVCGVCLEVVTLAGPRGAGEIRAALRREHRRSRGAPATRLARGGVMRPDPGAGWCRPACSVARPGRVVARK